MREIETEVEGVPTILSWDFTQRREDWSEVRSPGRARRRMKAGKPQRVKVFNDPRPGHFEMDDGTMVVHPSHVRELQQELWARQRFEEATRRAGVDLPRALLIQKTWQRDRRHGLSHLLATGWWRASLHEEIEARHVWDEAPVEMMIELVDFALRVRDGRQVVVCGNLEVEEI